MDHGVQERHEIVLFDVETYAVGINPCQFQKIVDKCEQAPGAFPDRREHASDLGLELTV